MPYPVEGVLKLLRVVNPQPNPSDTHLGCYTRLVAWGVLRLHRYCIPLHTHTQAPLGLYPLCGTLSLRCSQVRVTLHKHVYFTSWVQLCTRQAPMGMWGAVTQNWVSHTRVLQTFTIGSVEQWGNIATLRAPYRTLLYPKLGCHTLSYRHSPLTLWSNGVTLQPLRHPAVPYCTLSWVPHSLVLQTIMIGSVEECGNITTVRAP